jgi:hypothetical protein
MDANIEENAWLEGTRGVLSGKKLDLQKEETLLGRGSGCHIQIKDPKVSRSHASLKVQVTGLTITDLDSASGTIVNGKRVSSSVLKDGDVIQLGDSTFEVCFKQDAIPTMLEPEPPSAPPPAPPRGVSAPVTPPPVPPPPPPVMIPSQDGKSGWKPIAVGCGGLLILTVCAVGVYFIYSNFFAFEEPTSEASLAREITLDEIADEPAELDLDPSPTMTPSPNQGTTDENPVTEEDAGESEDEGLVIRGFSDETDGYLNPFEMYADLDNERSTSIHGYYSGTWPEVEPAVIHSTWCAIDKETLDENYPYVRMELMLDGVLIPLEDLTYEEISEPSLYCHNYRGVLEGLPVGEHLLVSTYYFDAEITDGWSLLGPGTDIVEYAIEVLPWISVLDSFEEASGDWAETQQSNFNLTQGDSKFVIEIFKEYFTAWSLYDDLVLDDVTILTSAVRASEGQGAYGIVFRYQDVNNFYYFWLDDDGYFEIGKRVDGKFVPLEGPTYSEVILRNGENNKLALIVAGAIFHAYINFEEVATVIDEEFDAGQLGMMASTPLGTNDFKAEFDYFSIDAEDKTR